MGRGSRASSSGSQQLRPGWSWQEESIAGGKILEGPGRDGRVALLDDGETVLRLSDGMEYDRPPAFRPLLVAGSDNSCFAVSRDYIFNLDPDESERESFFAAEPLALYPTAEGMRVVYRGEEEGVLYQDFDEYLLAPTGEYVLYGESEDVIASPLGAPASGGVALAAPGELFWSGPGGDQRWDMTLQPGWVLSDGDPYNPFLLVLDRNRRKIFSPSWGEQELPQAARDWDIRQSGEGKSFTFLAGDAAYHLSGSDLQQTPSEDEACRLLRSGEVVLAGQEGVRLWRPGEEPEVILDGDYSSLRVSLRDESIADIIVDDQTLLRGEI